MHRYLFRLVYLSVNNKYCYKEEERSSIKAMLLMVLIIRGKINKSIHIKAEMCVCKSVGQSVIVFMLERVTLVSKLSFNTKQCDHMIDTFYKDTSKSLILAYIHVSLWICLCHNYVITRTCSLTDF